MQDREISMLTFESVLDKRHWIVVLSSAHGLDARAETGDGQHDDIANLLGRLHASKVLPGDVALAGAHVEVVRVVEKVEDGICPARRAGEFDDAPVVLCELALGLALEGLVGYVGDDVDKNGVAGLCLHGPLAELDAAGVPLGPVWAVWVSLDANNHAVGVGGNI